LSTWILVVVAMTVFGCSRNQNEVSEEDGLVVHFAINEDHSPEFGISGVVLGYYYSSDEGSFDLNVGDPLGALGESGSGNSAVRISGTYSISEEGIIDLEIVSESDRDFRIQLLGISANKDDQRPSDDIHEVMSILAGKQTNSLQAHVLYTWEL